MARKRTRRQKAILRRNIILTVLVCILISAIVLVSLAVTAIVRAIIPDEAPESVSSSTKVEQQLKPEEKPATATILSTGDIMVHSTQLDGAHTSDGGYDFSAFFKNIKSYVEKADLAIANLEVTFGGNDGRKYSGYPGFNTPDVLADNLKNAGFDLLLTANNHCYDTGASGFKRTLEILKDRKLDYNGTRGSESEPNYLVKNVNGIKVGMISYTYETKPTADGRKTVNGIAVSSECTNLINSFKYEAINEFYGRAKQAITDMKSKGAEFIVFYMHWGEEYQLKENTHQKSIAQELCNMGVNLIIGGHPHVIQPVSLLHSEDSENTAVCLYSMGNAVSNQRKELMDSCPTGHTEDGMLFSYTLEKTKNGKVSLKSIDIIPTWVERYRGGSGFQYTIHPLVGDNTEKSRSSYERTKAIVGSGLTECQKHLGCELTFKESEE